AFGRAAKEEAPPVLSQRPLPDAIDNVAGVRLTSVSLRSPHTSYSRQFANNAKSIRIVSDITIIPEPRRAANVGWFVRKRTAAQSALPTLFIQPGRAVGGGAAIAVVPAILHPFRGIAGRVYETEGIRRKASYRTGLTGDLATATMAASPVGLEIVTPEEVR